MTDVAVIGAGAWGTALAIQAARAGRNVSLWVRDADRAAGIARSRSNPRLPGITLSDAIEVTTDLAACGVASMHPPVSRSSQSIRIYPNKVGVFSRLTVWGSNRTWRQAW